MPLQRSRLMQDPFSSSSDRSNPFGAVVPAGNKLWLATSGGVVRYDRASGATKVYADVSDIPDLNITAGTIDNAGDLWFGTAAGFLIRCHPQTENFYIFQRTRHDRACLAGHLHGPDRRFSPYRLYQRAQHFQYCKTVISECKAVRHGHRHYCFRHPGVRRYRRTCCAGRTGIYRGAGFCKHGLFRSERLDAPSLDRRGGDPSPARQSNSQPHNFDASRL